MPDTVFLTNAEFASKQLAHRGPNGSGVELGEGFCFAHRRLAIFDTSALGIQPMTGWGHTIVFNGAVYNWKELREELTKAGYQFRSQTDTEVILAAYDQWGTNCFERFNGMWAMAIATPEARKIVLSRDRFGIKPLYYALDNGLTFSSEPKVVASTSGRQPQINRQVAKEFIEYGWQDHRPETLYEGVMQFPPGHYAIVTTRGALNFRLAAYHDLQQASSLTPVPKNRKEAIDKLRCLLIDSVVLRTRSDVGRCVTLSGGIDSSSIAGMMTRFTQVKPSTYSALFPDYKFDESRYVTAVKQLHGLRGITYRPSYEEVLGAFAATQRAQGQPIASLAVVVHYELMRTIRDHGERVLLNGQGADEIGGGYDKFYLPLIKEELRRQPLVAFGTMLRYVTQQPVNLGKTVSRLSGLYRQSGPGRSSIAGSYFDLPDQDLFCRSRDLGVYETSVNLIKEVGLPVLLRHEDRNTMAFGLESRAPFLDHRVVEFMLALPANWKIRHAIRKHAIRSACREVLPDEVFYRYNKLGFATPATQWMEQDADRYLRSVDEGVKLGFFSDTTGGRCRAALHRRARNEYSMLFRCYSWMQFVTNEV
ncbi:asparagine synthase (glutamine-hydrolysing) [Neolewinella xylanilytica]|uniref:asparagine synthase (glutamine-hydrolyzing) n=1 Tax=Neolewinella xylanilytica TaxID=1514080 RepID=A0A2S6I0T2_9BACT|nr:asparagine synthase (glutamine-hydrolysing) [Neolewinella xylanilytica]